MDERKYVLPHFFNVVPAGLFILNSDGHWKDLNIEFANLLGFDRRFLFSIKPVELIHPDDVRAHQSVLLSLFNGRVGFLKLELRFRRSTGDYVWMLITIGAVNDEDNTIRYFAGCINNIEPIKQRESFLRSERDELFMLSHELYKIATTDSLTGMANRRQFMHWYSVEYKNNKNPFRPFSLALMDIDCFKEYNDTYGHHEGDKALRNISIEIMSALNVNTKVARFGGEEFIMLILNTHLRSGEEVCEELRCKIEGITYLKRSVTVSIGLVTLLSDAEIYDFDALYKLADSMLYVSKDSGRNVVKGVKVF